MKIRVLLADDHHLVIDALQRMLAAEPDIEIAGLASNGVDVPSLAKQTRADVVCMDISMPGMNGIEATAQILASYPSVKVIGLSASADPRFILDMLKAGALGYVTKSGAGEDLLRAIRAVSRRQTYLCPIAASAVAGAMCASSAPGRLRAGQLGTRERQVLQLVAEGHTSSEIAKLLHIAPSTVEVHRRNLMRKLDIHSVAELTTYAIRCGLVGDVGLSDNFLPCHQD